MVQVVQRWVPRGSEIGFTVRCGSIQERELDTSQGQAQALREDRN